MFAAIAALFFGLALIIDLADIGLGGIVAAATLATTGLIFVAAHITESQRPLRTDP